MGYWSFDMYLVDRFETKAGNQDRITLAAPVQDISEWRMLPILE